MVGRSEARVLVVFGVVLGSVFGCGGRLVGSDAEKSVAPEPGTNAPAPPHAGNSCVGCSPTPPCQDGPCAPADVATFTLFGGSDKLGHYLDDTWEWREKSGWIERSVSDPSARPSARSSAAMASLNGRIVLFGGITNGAQTAAGLGDTWEWDGAAWTQQKVVGPGPRWDSKAATLGSKVVLFGGYSGTAYLGDTWEWDGRVWTERQVPGPRARTFHAMAAFGDKILLYGGQGDDGMLSDTWEWDGSAWTERDVSQGPEARESPALATLSGKPVLFGGGVLGKVLDQTWEWNGSWTDREVTGPSGRGSAAMAAGVGTLVLFGGNTVQGSQYLYFADTWAWDGSAWARRSESGPAGRTGAAMAAIVSK